MIAIISRISIFFFFNDTATTEIYTLSLHDALPICRWCRLEPRHRGHVLSRRVGPDRASASTGLPGGPLSDRTDRTRDRSEEHTSELQSQSNLVCRLLLEKKKKKRQHNKTCVYTTSI